MNTSEYIIDIFKHYLIVHVVVTHGADISLYADLYPDEPLICDR